MKKKQDKHEPYAPVLLPTVPRLLLTTDTAQYWGIAEVVYVPITGGIHVHRVRLERRELAPLPDAS